MANVLNYNQEYKETFYYYDISGNLERTEEFKTIEIYNTIYLVLYLAIPLIVFFLILRKKRKK